MLPYPFQGCPIPDGVPGYWIATAAALALLAVVYVYRGPICLQCGGRLKHRDDCHWKRLER